MNKSFTRGVGRRYLKVIFEFAFFKKTTKV
jgi:hypothetical protein